MPTTDDTIDDTLARHRVLNAVFNGERKMSWTEWALPIYDVKSLTPQGREAALWAVGVLRRAFGDAFLAQVWERQRARPPIELWQHPQIHPVLGQGLWPGMNTAPWVFANLLQLAAQIQLLFTESKDVRKSMRTNLEAINWIHGLLQFEVAGLALRAGWRPTFEPPLGTDKLAGVHLDGPSAPLLVEVRSLRMWQRESQAIEAAGEMPMRLSMSLNNMAADCGVQVSGSVENLTTLEEVEAWARNVGAAMMATAQDGTPCEVSGPTEGTLRVTRDVADPPALTFSGPQGWFDPWGVLARRLKEKAEQARGASQPVWVRVEDDASLWFAHSSLALAEKLGVFTPLVREMLEPYPDLAGVILAPAVLWASDAPPDRLREVIVAPGSGAVAVRSALPYHRARETIIVAQAGVTDLGLETFAGWYADEADWLDWALERLGQPPFAELFQAEPGDS
jgi:hypothetical protein